MQIQKQLKTFYLGIYFKSCRITEIIIVGKCKLHIHKTCLRMLDLIFSDIFLLFTRFQDIHGSFPDLGIVSIIIETNDGRYKAGAKLSVENPEVLDDWPESRRNVFVKNKEVSVCVGNSDGWLCVAKLPLSYSEEDFVHLAGLYGKVREAFLMISEKTGNHVLSILWFSLT